jgi:RNA polymerase sigma-70 factor (ECF subfamily)
MESASPLTAEILMRHEAFVLRLARTLVRGESNAEDVAQRTLAAAIESPPRHGRVRDWLVRVTRNNALDLHRSERRRTAREQRAARPEAVPSGLSAMERLEVEHGVVRAVLALEEPYKGVIVATYYEGLTPAEIAARRGAPAGTVRSQLARAHELLRSKLDREHGERAQWLRGMTGLLAARSSATSATLASAAKLGLGWPLAIGAGVAASIASVFAVRAALAPPLAPGWTAVQPVAPPVTTGERDLAATAPMLARTPIEADPTARSAAASTFTPADEPAKLLEQSRQIKRLILERRLAVTADERERAGIPADSATSGVVRLLERSVFGEKFSLPWMRNGGTYYSFTERVHDYNRRPQISLQGDMLGSAFYGASSALLVDLGERRLADVPNSPTAPAWLEPSARFLWEVAHAELDPSSTSLRTIFAERSNEAFERGQLDEASLAALERLPRENVRVRVNHSYLVRCVSKDEHDLVVALEAIAVSPEQCTLAWRILDSRPVADPDRVRVPELGPGDLPAPPAELESMTEPALRAALVNLGARADQVLFDRFTPEVEARFGSLRGRTDAGLVRLTPYLSKWTELSPRQLGGAQYSFTVRSHDGYGHVSLQGPMGKGSLGGGLGGGDMGSFVDLGSAPLESASIATIESSGELGQHLVHTTFPVVLDLPTLAPARQQALREARDRDQQAEREFRQRRDALGGADSAHAVVGRTYGIRATHFGVHDVLAVVHVAAEDEQGVVLAWRLLKSWPVNEPR